MWYRAWHDDSGQDLIEYSLLLLVVAVGLILVVPTLSERMAAAYQRWIGPSGVNSLWIPNPPA